MESMAMSILPLSLLLLLSLNLFGIDQCESKIFGQNQKFECVDIYKQPVFDHPLLKNHKLQMKPSSMPKIESTGELPFGKFANFENQIKACPQGMVPIAKYRLDDNKLNQLRSSAKFHGANSDVNFIEGVHHIASLVINGKGVHGGRAAMTVYNPPVTSNQISSSQITVQNGEGDDFSAVQVGWAVHPDLYGDNRTHLTALWTADNSKTTGCYNSLCPGFVQIHPAIPLGLVYDEVSVIRGKQILTQPTIRKDDRNNYWLWLHNGTIVGYWPGPLLNKLQEGIQILSFDARTFSRTGVSPPMGSGHFPDKDYSVSSYYLQIQVMDGDGYFYDIGDHQVLVDDKNCYDLQYWGNQGGYLKVTFSYGGPGGNCPV